MPRPLAPFPELLVLGGTQASSFNNFPGYAVDQLGQGNWIKDLSIPFYVRIAAGDMVFVLEKMANEQ